MDTKQDWHTWFDNAVAEPTPHAALVGAWGHIVCNGERVLDGELVAALDGGAQAGLTIDELVYASAVTVAAQPRNLGQYLGGVIRNMATPQPKMKAATPKFRTVPVNRWMAVDDIVAHGDEFIGAALRFEDPDEGEVYGPVHLVAVVNGEPGVPTAMCGITRDWTRWTLIDDVPQDEQRMCGNCCRSLDRVKGAI